MRLAFIELNELNFDFIEGYIARGELPTFARFFQQHGFTRTISETQHEKVDPWIQWVTAHTGLEFAEHKVFRMGDMYYNEHEQIWERLERAGLKVGALAPFNATNRAAKALFFMPDPWMRTPFVGPTTLRYLNEALVQVANDYAQNRIAPASVLKLGAAAAAHMQWRHLPSYARDTWRFFRHGRWHRALVADRLLGDTFLSLWDRYRPDFASVGLNAGAHLQHHYMFASPLCRTTLQNPEWWIAKGVDPVLEAYRVYDEFLADLQRRDPEARIMLVSGLSQEGHERVAHYYRLNAHREFFRTLGIPFKNIQPLMTEDFVVEYDNAADALTGQRALEEVQASQADVFYAITGDFSNRGVATAAQVFFVDNRGSTLYVQLKPTAREIPAGMSVSRPGRTVPSLLDVVAHAQLKNGHHNGVGYFADSQLTPGQLPDEMRLSHVFDLVLQAFDVAREAGPAGGRGAPGGAVDRPPAGFGAGGPIPAS